MTAILTMLIIAMALAVNVTVLSIVLAMRRPRLPRITVREVPVVKEVIREVPRIRESPRRREVEVSDEYIRSRFHERD